DGQIILNGEAVPQEDEPRLRIPADQQICDGRPCLDVFSQYRTRLSDRSPLYEVPTSRETLPNGASYLIIDHQEQWLDNFDETVRPDGHVLLVGDDRDRRADRRAPVEGRGVGGRVPISNVGGRGEIITCSLGGSA